MKEPKLNIKQRTNVSNCLNSSTSNVARALKEKKKYTELWLPDYVREVLKGRGYVFDYNSSTRLYRVRVKKSLLNFLEGMKACDELHFA